jgi:hypothetical protein
MLITLLVGGVLLLPSLVLLFTLFQRPPRPDGGAGVRLPVPVAAVSGAPVPAPAAVTGRRPLLSGAGYLIGALWRRR